LIVPNSFLNDDFTDAGMINEINKRFSFVCQFDLPVDAFKMYGVDVFVTKGMIFQKWSVHLTSTDYSQTK